MLNEYILTFLGLWVLIMLMIAQNIVATVAHRKQKGLTGTPNDLANLTFKDFAFRAHRVFQNSLENAPIFFIPVFMAMFLGMYNLTLAVIVWLYVVSRVGHMAFYYKSEENKVPNPKSMFYMLGFVVNIFLMFALLLQIFTM